MGSMYNSGQALGVNTVNSTGSRIGDFTVGAGSTAHTIQTSAPSTYQPHSTLDPVYSNPNGQSQSTQESAYMRSLYNHQ